MKKIFFFGCVAALALTSCSSDDFLGSVFGSEGNGEITFATMSRKATRAGDLTGADAAEKLGKEFVVYGFKSGGFAKGSPADGSTSATQGHYADTKSDVFQNYVVTWAGNPGSTESNTHGWEYVGYKSRPIGGTGVDQSIKYWDYSADEYDFLAWSVKGNATIEAIKEDEVAPYKPHSLVFTAPTAADLANVYVANQVTVLKDGSKATTGGTLKPEAQTYKEKVLLTFRNMAAKVRIGIYETVPGYSVRDVHFYTDASSVANTNPATLFASSTAFATAGTVTAKFYDGNVGTENDVVATTAASELGSTAQFGALTNFADAEYKENADSYIGRASNEASMSTGTDNGWTYEFPMPATELNLKVDYTLVSKDGSGEVIKVTGASAKVPANYGEWKSNYAYTYLFKISDNTPGSTGNPSTDPAGLYPITFDACVVAVQDGNTQETITEVADIAITTYQNGSKITSENEYHASTEKYIYVNNSIAAMAASNTKLYTAIDLGKDKEGITEETVANYMNNDIVLTNVSDQLQEVGDIEASQTIDNVNITLTQPGVRFLPAANTIYVVEYDFFGKKYYKVIKVGPNAPTATYTLAFKTGSLASIAEGGSTIITVKNGDNIVTGAKNYFTGADDFTVSEETPGEYTFTAKAGTTTGTKSIKLNSSNALDITVNAYAFATATGKVSEGGTGDIILNLGTDAAVDVNVADNLEIQGTTGVTISSVASGSVKLSATVGADDGKIVFKNGGVVVAEADIHVKKYSVALKSGNKAIINGTSSKTILVLSLDDVPSRAQMKSSNTAVATVGETDSTTGELEVTNAGVGTATISKGSAKMDIECTNFGVMFYTDDTCTSEANGNLNQGTTYYAKFTDNGIAKNVTGLTAQGCSIAKMAKTGVYKVTVASADTATIEYTYKGVTFELASAPVVSSSN